MSQPYDGPDQPGGGHQQPPPDPHRPPTGGPTPSQAGGTPPSLGGPTPPPPGGATPQDGPTQQPQGAPVHYGQPPRPLSPTEERNFGMLAHLVAALALPLSFGTLGFVASLVIYLLYKDRGPFVRQHAANSLNVQIITAILLLASLALMIVLVGFVTYPLVIIGATVIHVIGAIRAYNGEWWMPPLTPRFVS